MDERELAELFRETVRALPPASFDVHDVEKAAHRSTVRRRLALIGGGVAAVVLLVGGAGITSAGFRGPSGTEALAPASHPASTSSERIAAQPDERGNGSGLLLEPGGTCGPPDPALAAALAQQLPAAAGMTPLSARGSCPPGSRNAAFVLRDGTSVGEVMVVLSPANQALSESAGGTRKVTSRARNGELLTVLSDPDAGSPSAPYAARLGTIAASLAARF